MNRKSESFLRRMHNDQAGTVYVWAIFLLGLMLGMGGLTVDIGHAYICYRLLQASTDAAALAAASALPTKATAISEGTLFSSKSGNYNAFGSLNTPSAVTGAAVTVTPGCVTVTGLPSCGGSVVANAVRVVQTVTVPTFFIRALAVFKISAAQSISLTAESTAVMRGALRGPYDVALVLDTTASMQTSDGGSNCTGTKIQCAEQGAQILLSELQPCLMGSTCGSATNGNVAQPVDEVSLFTFPAQTVGTQVADDEPCATPSPSPIKYPDSTTLGTLTNLPTTANLNTLVSEYGVVPLSSNYRTSDSTTGSNPLTVSSTAPTSTTPSIVNAVGGNSYFGGTSCTGMQAKGGESTFYAGALFTAQQYLAINGRSNAANVLILLGDGDANGGKMGSSSLNSAGVYPSANGQCQQAIAVANAAKAAGTKVYVVGYGVASGGCSTDVSPYNNACYTLRNMASSDANFFVDTSSVACPGATSVVMNGSTNTLSGIFTAIVGDLTKPRLVPNTITFTAS
ncbi:MAG TPA: pilus assembly protein TadG-related protein [Terracidiphilus sp.]|nr:pilus assembly protein TadG-related protein [Terracidiphilus sp.]